MKTTISRAHLTVVFFLCTFVSISFGCKSKEKNEQSPAGVAKSTGVAAPPSKPLVSQSVDVWDEPQAPPLPVPDVPADPDALIDRYDKECGNAGNSAECHTMRLQVERIFLYDLVALRAEDQEIDRTWYRIAANSETPQLACIGLRELIYGMNPTPEEEALIIAAIESPFRENRSLALSTNLPKIKELWPRARNNRSFDGGVCMSDLRDPDPGVKWAGGYPGARFRHFASNSDLRWFTTPDPEEKVLAFFKNQGKPPRTMEEIGAAEQAKFVEEANKISMNPQPDSDKKLMDLVQNMGSSITWDQNYFNGLEGVGQVRYVMLSPKQAIAIFKDDILHATSIVAPRPRTIDRYLDVNMEKEMEKAKDEELARRVYKY